MDTRKASISGRYKIVDDEIGSNETKSGSVSESIYLSDEQPSGQLISHSDCAGGEVRAELELSAQLLDSGDMRISGSAMLFEGTSCSTTEKEDEETIEILVPKGKSTSKKIFLLSEGAGGGDNAEYKLHISNRDA